MRKNLVHFVRGQCFNTTEMLQRVFQLFWFLWFFEGGFHDQRIFRKMNKRRCTGQYIDHVFKSTVRGPSVGMDQWRAW